MKTALITGASRGIGRAIAKRFAAEGYAVILHYNSSRDRAMSLLEEIRAGGTAAMAVKADLTSAEETAALFDAVYSQFSAVDVLINNAGTAQQKLFTDITEADWDGIFDLCVKGAFRCAQAVLPGMLRRHSGKIINISSVWGITGASCEVHYSAAKAALIGFTKALAKEVGPSGIHVNCIAPGVIDTEMNAMLSNETLCALKEETPLGRLGTVEDIAQTVLFLASEKADFITGQVFSPNGGFLI